VLGLATSGSPLVALVKQSGEFGLQSSGLKIALLAAFITDIHSLGLKDMQGLVFSTIFYWDRTDSSRAWSERFFKTHGAMPTQMQAAAYTAATHYLKAVQKAGTTDAQKVVPIMKEMRIQDPLFDDAYVRKDGMVIRPAFFVQVKTPAESRKPWDYYKILATIPGDEAYMSMKDQGCPLVQ
jgi:branched-chain amino acid transport system substrate-binding protein